MSRKLATNVLFVAAAATLGLYLSRGPWLAYREQKSKADAATRDMLKAEKERSDLLREKANVESPMGREAAARARGYMKPNELPAETGG